MGMKPDRLVMLVGSDKVPEHDHMNAHSCVGGKLSYYHPCRECGAGMKTFRRSDVLALLRREQRAQRARVVKIVKDELAYRIKRHRDPLEDVSAVAACKSILAKLHGRTP